MDKIKVLVILLLISIRSIAQIPVTDGALNATANVQTLLTIKDLAEAFQQGETLVKTYKGIKEGIEVYKKVSGFIKDSRMVANLLQDQYKIIEDAGKTMKVISKSRLTKGSIINADRAISDILSSVDRNMDMLFRILTDQQVKTDDGQRLALVNQIIESNEKEKRKLESIKRIYAEMDQNQKLYDRIRNEKRTEINTNNL
jgi:hypothetical protein